ncbi:MAG: geranylgeranylglyceryl phosphate synthase family protein [Bacteroidetes bacterium]|nr:geranylgeranylglyceryl phosphate synthase family protein [Bacteroidota bacterium]
MKQNSIIDLFNSKVGQIAILIDPDKCDLLKLEEEAIRYNTSVADFIFVGGSTVEQSQFKAVCKILQEKSSLPIVGFPGDVFQYSSHLDALLYLSLLSGRNPEYLIGQHLHTSIEISKEPFEVIPTAYLLIDGNRPSSVAYVSQTTPIPQDQFGIIERTAMAGKLQGKRLLYLDAGSGAKISVSPKVIENLRNINLPIIVGGGLRTKRQLLDLAQVGTNVLVIGNYMEENPDFLIQLQEFKKERSQSLKTGS